MNEILDQQAGQRPSLPTGSRQEAQSCGSATSTARPKTARMATMRRASRRGDASRSVTPSAMARRIAVAHGSQLVRRGGLCSVMMARSPIVFDRKLLRRRRRRALALAPPGFLLDRVAEDAADRIATVLRRFDLALDLGTPGEALRRALAASGKVGTIIAADALVDRAGQDDRTSALTVVCDEEALPFRDASLDLVTS